MCLFLYYILLYSKIYYVHIIDNINDALLRLLSHATAANWTFGLNSIRELGQTSGHRQFFRNPQTHSHTKRQQSSSSSTTAMSSIRIYHLSTINSTRCLLVNFTSRSYFWKASGIQKNALFPDSSFRPRP